VKTPSDLKLYEARAYDYGSHESRSHEDVITARRWFSRLMVAAMFGCALWDAFHGIF